MAIDVERLKLVNGFVFPKEDTECSAVMFEEVRKLKKLPLRQYGVAVQAGGNCGVFPVYLSQMFEFVFTFEPDPLNYECLLANLDRFVTGGNTVTSFQAGLSNKRSMGHMVGDRSNCGALQVEEGGDINLLRLDDLGLAHCDLIYLDIEGYEDLALEGARELIDANKPVIVCENKGLNERFPSDFDGSEDFRDWVCAEFGYVYHSRLMRDDVFVCSK